MDFEEASFVPAPDSSDMGFGFEQPQAGTGSSLLAALYPHSNSCVCRFLAQALVLHLPSALMAALAACPLMESLLRTHMRLRALPVPVRGWYRYGIVIHKLVSRALSGGYASCC